MAAGRWRRNGHTLSPQHYWHPGLMHMESLWSCIGQASASSHNFGSRIELAAWVFSVAGEIRRAVAQGGQP